MIARLNKYWLVWARASPIARNLLTVLYYQGLLRTFIYYCFYMLIWEYNLTINNSNQKLFISVHTENNKNKV